MSPDRTDVRGVRARVTQQLHPEEQVVAEGVSMLARRTDPAFQDRKPATASASRGGVRWVSASDLLKRKGMGLADLHAAGQEHLVRTMRHGMGQIASHSAARVRSAFPPVSTFGTTVQAPTREAVGS